MGRSFTRGRTTLLAIGMVLALLAFTALPAMAGEATKELAPGKGVEFSNTSDEGVSVTTSAGEGLAFDLVVTGGEPREEAGSTSEGIEVPAKGKVSVTALPGNTGKLSFTYEIPAVRVKDLTKPVLERRRLKAGETLDLSVNNADRTVWLVRPEGSETGYDLARYTERTKFDRFDTGVVEETLSLSGTDRVLLTVPEGLGALEVVFGPQVKALVAKEPGVRRWSLMPGKDMEATNSSTTEPRTITLVSGTGSTVDYAIVDKSRKNVTESGRAQEAGSITIPGGHTAIISLPAGAEGPVQVLAEGATVKFKDAARPAFATRELNPGESVELTCSGADNATVYLGSEFGVRYDYTLFSQKKVMGFVEQAVEETVSVPPGHRLLLTSGAEGPLTVVYGPTLAATAAAKAAYTREILTAGKGYTLKNNHSEDVRVRLVVDGVDGNEPVYDLALYAKEVRTGFEEAVRNTEITIPANQRVLVTVREPQSVLAVINPSLVTLAESKESVLERKTLKAGENAEIRNKGSREVGIRWMSLSGEAGVPLDFALLKDGKMGRQGFSEVVSTLDVPGNTTLMVSVPDGVEGAVAVYEPSKDVVYGLSGKSALDRHTVKPGEGLEITNGSGVQASVYTDAGNGKTFDYALVATDGSTRMVLDNTSTGITLRVNERLCISVPSEGSAPLTVTVGSGARVVPTPEPALRRRLVKPGEGVSYTNSFDRDLFVSAFGANGSDAVLLRLKEGGLLNEAEVEGIVGRNQEIRVAKGETANLAVPSAAPAPVWITAYEPLFTVQPTASPALGIQPGGSVRLSGTLRAPMALGSYSLMAIEGKEASSSRIISTARVPNATDINLSSIVTKGKPGESAGAGEYSLVLKGADTRGVEVELFRIPVRAAGIFTSFTAEYLPESDVVKARAVVRPGAMEAATQGIFDIPVMLGVIDAQAERGSINTLALLAGAQQLPRSKSDKDAYEAEISGDRFPRGVPIRVWPYVMNYATGQAAPEQGSVTLTVSSMPPSAVLAAIDWVKMEFTIGIEPRTGVSLDPFGPRNEPKLPPYRFEAAVRTRVPEGSPVSAPLAVFSGNLEKDRDNGGRLVARIPLTGIPHQQGQELEFLVGVAPVDNNTQGALLDAEGKPVAAALGKTVTYPWPSADPAAVTLTADLTMGKVRVAGRLKAVPENWFVILSDPNGKEWRVRIRRYEPTDIEARIKSDFGLAEIGFNPAVQDGYSLLVKDTDGVEVLRLPLKTVLAPLPKAGDEEDDLFFDDERDANSFTNGGIDLNTIMKMFQNQGTGVGGNGTGAAGTAPFVAPGTPGGSTSMDADALQRMMEAMLADGANPPAPDAPDTGGGNDGIWFSDGE